MAKRIICVGNVVGVLFTAFVFCRCVFYKYFQKLKEKWLMRFIFINYMLKQYYVIIIYSLILFNIVYCYCITVIPAAFAFLIVISIARRTDG